MNALQNAIALTVLGAGAFFVYQLMKWIFA